VTKRLGDFAAAVSTGPFGSILHKSDYVDDGVPLVNPINIVGDSIVPDPSKLISEVTIKRLSNYVLEEGDIVVGRRGEIGRCAVVGPNESGWVCGTGSFFIRPLPSLDSQFLAHLIRSPEYRQQLEKLSTGATMKNLSNTALGDLVVSVPPLAEQQRIVGLLDEAFEGLATAKANAEKNLQNARALFESHLQAVFTQGGPGWVETTLEQATAGVFTGPFGSLLHKHDYIENGIPLVNPAHITDTGIEPDMRKTVSEATAKRLANYIMNEGDVVIGRRGEMGRCALVTEVEDGWLCGTGSFFIKPSERCDMGYLVHYLRSDGCRKHLEALAGGAVMPNLSNTALGGLSIFLPSLREQKEIVNEIDALSAETQRLASLYERKLAALEALKKSLLHQAFSGTL
jgi:type I restriction enzyme S subunit